MRSFNVTQAAWYGQHCAILALILCQLRLTMTAAETVSRRSQFFLSMFFFFFQAEDGIRDVAVTGVQTCALPIFFRYKSIVSDDGEIVRWFATATDIDDRKRGEDRMRNEAVALREDIVRSSMFEEIVGTSKALREILAQISKVAPTDSTVLIQGETRTGKELIARAIHNRSKRANRAFIRVNCAAIPPSLIASELFGHEKGAFTGALQKRLGCFESSHGGTILLDG